MNYQVYAIRTIIGTRIYIGQTQDLAERFEKHNAGHVYSTRLDRPWILVAAEEFETRAQARWLERQLKSSQGRRERWMRQNASKT